MTDDPHDAAALDRYAGALGDAVDASLPAWVVRVVGERWRQWRGTDPPDELVAAARDAGERARDALVPALRELLATDVEAQRTNPLALLRRATPHATEVLRRAGVPPVERDGHAAALFPEDDYDLSPASFADIDPAVHEPGLVWGAAKAHIILARRRR